MSLVTVIVSALLLFISSTVAYSPTNKYTEILKSNSKYPQLAYNKTPSGNILAVLKDNGLTTFVDLITKAGLEETFSQPRPFIVWAPTNEAFAAIVPETLNFILSDASLLKDILTYHLGLFKQPYTLVPAIKNELTLPTVQGEVTRINVYRKKGSSFVSERTVTVNGALVVNALPAGDSLIYVIDRVLNPQDLNPSNTKTNYLRKHPEFSIFLSIYEILGLAENSFKTLRKTVFIPTNAAFQALPVDEFNALFADEQALVILLNRHTASGALYSRGLVSGPLPVFSGVNIEINVSHGGIAVENANIIKADITTFDGVLHVIDAVISSAITGNSTITSEFDYRTVTSSRNIN